MRSSETYTEFYSNICNTLDMAPGGQPYPPEMGNSWISWKLLRSPPLNHIYSCSLWYRQYMQYIRYGPWGSTSPLRNGKLLNVSKTIEIPTPKPYIFLFLVSRNMWWYIGYDHTRWPCPPLSRKCPNILKTVEIPTPKPHISLILVSGDIWWYIGHDHTLWSRPSEKEVS
jgi:hypothetical protein